MNRILIAEDDEPIANLIRMNLVRAGYHCQVANDGVTAADLMSEHTFDLCLFDIMLPQMDGYELLQYAKRLNIPVIFLTAKGETMDKVQGLKAGADDYIVKPFEIIELLARIENILRRFKKTNNIYKVNNLQIDVSSRIVKKDDVIIDLTYKEFDLLLLFVKNPNVALYREVIYEQVWGSQFLLDSRTVDLHVQRLRKKTGLEKEITSVYKVGYRFCQPDLT